MLFLQAEYKSGEIIWRDRKRWLWILSVLSPAVPLVGCALVYFTGNPFWALATHLLRAP